MILIAEILLTIFAWRRGWKGYALLPLAIALLIGVIIGLSMGSTGSSIESIKAVALVFDILAIITLIIMNVKAPISKQEPKEPKSIN